MTVGFYTIYKGWADKTVYDFTEQSEYNAIPDDVSMLFARLMAKMTGYSRYIIDAYIPLKELRAKFISAFPSYSVRDMFEKAILNNSNSKVEGLYRQVFDISDRLASKGYDIEDLRFLYLWDDNKTVEPTLCRRSLRKRFLLIILTMTILLSISGYLVRGLTKWIHI